LTLLTSKEIKEITKFACQEKLYCIYEPQNKNQENSSKIKIIHKINLIAYSPNEEEKIGQLKPKIRNIIKPSLLYVFDPLVNK